MKPSLLIAAGCSWVAARAIDADPNGLTLSYDYVEDPEFVQQHSFAGLIQQRLGLDTIYFTATHGSNNQEQLNQLISFIETNQDQYSHIFVLWGITSIYRWQMFSQSTGQVESCMVGRDPKKPTLEKEIKEYFSNHWNKEYELHKLGNDIVLLNGYLNNLGIDHLIFNSFQSYTNADFKINDVDTFYKIKENENDLLSFLCKKNQVKITGSRMPWLNLSRPREEQFNNNSVKELQTLGLLDYATAHPTVEAHKLIAEELYTYIKG